MITFQVSKVSSVCVSSRAPLTFKFQGKEFTIERDDRASAAGCLELALAAVEAEGVHSPAELAKGPFTFDDIYLNSAVSGGEERYP